jgi:hypothetical protein
LVTFKNQTTMFFFKYLNKIHQFINLSIKAMLPHNKNI